MAIGSNQLIMMHLELASLYRLALPAHWTAWHVVYIDVSSASSDNLDNS